jgi:hypothetical protein
VCWSIVVKKKPYVGSPYFGAFPSDRIPKAMKDVNAQFSVHSSNSCRLYRYPVHLHQRIPGTFWSYYTCRRTLWRNSIFIGIGVFKRTRHSLLVYHPNLRWILRDSGYVCNYREFPPWPIRAHPKLQTVFIILSKGYHHCDHLSSFRHRLLHLPDTRRTTQSWRNFGPALIGQTGKETPS